MSIAYSWGEGKYTGRCWGQEWFGTSSPVPLSTAVARGNHGRGSLAGVRRGWRADIGGRSPLPQEGTVGCFGRGFVLPMLSWWVLVAHVLHSREDGPEATLDREE